VWFSRQWKPVAIAAGIFVALTSLAMWAKMPAGPAAVVPTTGDVLGAFANAPATTEIADASALANVVSRKAIASQPLDATRVAQSDVLYVFLASAQSQDDRDAGKKLINLLAGAGVQPAETSPISIASVLTAAESAFISSACAAEAVRDPLYTGRQYQLQGRLQEAIAAYQGAGDASPGRVAIAVAAIRLCMRDYDGAQALLDGVAKDSDKRLSLLGMELSQEVRSARAAAASLAVERSGVINTAQQWNKVALLEVQAYDFENAASSFMKAAGAAPPELAALAGEARFRSAWCDVQSGQISTGIYGFKQMAPAGDKPTTVEYAAGIEEAIGLARLGKFDESVAVSKQLTALPAPSRSLEAVAYFQKGITELYGLKDSTAAAESLSRVTSAGQGNLSYAAEVILPGSH
jgi:tetratricopeptide (TPR) repeat protein